MKKVLSVGLSFVMGLGLLNVGAQQFVPEVSATSIVKEDPKYIFYFIGDGLGAEQKQVTEYYLQQVNNNSAGRLVMSQLPHTALTTTHATNSFVTDSAAAGTALATGYKTNSGMIAQLPDGTPVETIIEKAEKEGMATGLVSTTRMTHATPAAFATHNESRKNENEIAVDYLDSGVDYIAGGGIRHFVGQDYTGTDVIGSEISSKRTDNIDVVEEFEKLGYNTFIGAEGTKAFKEYTPNSNEQVLALFANTHMPYTVDAQNQYAEYEVPTLAEMVSKGIEVLEDNEEGFIMAIEGGRIDHASHAQDIAGTIHDTIAFDESIQVALDFYKAHPEETLIVVVGDHETGGLGMGFGTTYGLFLEQIEDVKVSVADTLGTVYNGDRKAYFDYIEAQYGLTNLTAAEKTAIERAMDAVDSKEDTKNVYGGYEPVSIATAHVLAERTNVQFTTYAHTGTVIPMYAIGVGAEHFEGSLDNTDVGCMMGDFIQ